MRVLLPAEWPAKIMGGIDAYLSGLLGGLSVSRSVDDEIVLLGPRSDPDWLKRTLPECSEVRTVCRRRGSKEWYEDCVGVLGSLRKPLGSLKRRLLGCEAQGNPVSVPTSDGFWESLEVDVVHQSYPLHYTRTAVPTVFTIHDLQHKHLPELFTASHLALRELLYPPAFAESRAIVAIANWVKQDVVEHYKISEKKIFVIPSAPGLGCNSEVSALLCAEVRQRYGLPQEFALYPALTYQHKNHIRLLDAVSVIERSGSKAIPIVCTGARKLFWNTIEDRRRQLGLEKAVRFTDFVPPEHLVALLRMAKFVVLPTLFEGVGLPLLEAFQNEVPVACSDIPAFREYGGTVPLYFNPRSAEEIAAALVRMNVDGVLRERIRSEGSQRARLYSWKESALKYWVVYRWAAGVQLSAEEQTILASMRGECLNGHRRASDVIV